MANIFGTDGIRGAVGSGYFTVPSLISIGQALGYWIQKTYGANASLLLAHDTRISSALVKNALKTGLTTHPLIIFDAQVLPSPALITLLKKNNNACGIIISASHNPYQDNGIKIVDAQTGKLSLDAEKEISALITDNNNFYSYHALGREYYFAQAQQLYKENILSYFSPNFLKNTRIVLDCAHGATAECAPDIFRSLGATVIPLHVEPNGYNINKECGSTHPALLQKAVIEHDADVGFAFDGDGDRIIAVNRLGHLKNGDDILALLLTHPVYAFNKTLVGTIMSNQGLEYYLAQQNKNFIRTDVGDKFVVQAMMEHESTLGGEPSGHIIARDYAPTGDGIFVALRLCEVLLSTNSMLDTFSKFPQVLANIPVQHRKDLAEDPLKSIIHETKQYIPEGRILIRYSGTEPLLRIMVEDSNTDKAQAVITRLVEQLKEFF